jgi:hypothetical protein
MSQAITKSKFPIQVLVLSAMLVLNGCRGAHDKSELVTSMKTYDRLLVKMDTDSLSRLYAPDGQLGDMATGPDSIRNFLNTFASYRVLSNESTTDSITIKSDTAFQYGKYHQVTILPSKDTASLNGQFEAKWIYSQKDGWKILRMATKPTP